MRIGLIARSEDRGLGNLTWEWAQHMRPERIVVVEPNHRIPMRRDRYPAATFVRWNHRLDSALDERAMRTFLDGLDVVYSAETFYDWRVVEWAREQGVKTVCHMMPEYYSHAGSRMPEPDAWWTPTRWRLEYLPETTRVVPVPIAVERFGLATPGRHRDDVTTFLHIAGARASGDRNGTDILLRALERLTQPARIRIRTQENVAIHRRLPHHVDVEIVREPTSEYWELYADADVHVLPRRYAGLSLPAMESMAAGLALVMPDVEPQRSEWPSLLVPVGAQGRVRTAGGYIPTGNVTPDALARTMDLLSSKISTLVSSQHEAVRFACSHSWEALEPTIRHELELVCS